MMLRILRRTIPRGSEITCIVTQTKRFAGHSKWQNIKHTKAENDAERAALFQKLAQQMRVAIAEYGSAKPTENLRLSQIIEVARKKNMPVVKINAVLEKAVATPSKVARLDVRGPGGCTVIIELLTDNLKGLRPLLNTIFKKTNVTVLEQNVRNVFLHKGFIITESKGDIDTATEDAIAVDAEEVEEIEIDGTPHFKFMCEALMIQKVVNLLGKLDYKVVASEDEYIPQICVSLSEQDIKQLEFFYTKLKAYNEVTRVHDNVV